MPRIILVAIAVVGLLLMLTRMGAAGPLGMNTVDAPISPIANPSELEEESLLSDQKICSLVVLSGQIFLYTDNTEGNCSGSWDFFIEYNGSATEMFMEIAMQSVLHDRPVSLMMCTEASGDTYYKCPGISLHHANH